MWLSKSGPTSSRSGVPIHSAPPIESVRLAVLWGENWHVFIETSDFDAAWASVPRPGIVVTEREIRNDSVLRPLFDDWRAGDDSAYRRFMDGVLGWTEDEDEPN
jgi:hypothetical protein